MKRYNIIMLVDAAGENVLMCRRLKPPYQGLYNLVGGKAETGEDGLHAAYRELREETGVTAADVTLSHAATFTYPSGGAGLPAYELQAYVGRLQRQIPMKGDENPLLWMPLTENFFDLKKFAGEGSIGHVAETVRRYCPGMLEVHAPAFTLEPLAEDDLEMLAYYQRRTVRELSPMLAESVAREHQGRYYEVFVIRNAGCPVGLCSLYAHDDGTVSDGVEIYLPFRRCGFAVKALALLADMAREKGYQVLRAQVRVDNTASLSLHKHAGFRVTRTYINRKGNEVCDMQLQLATTGTRHEMSLRPKPFAAIASGTKRYELRLHDEKRRRIRVGDELLFTCTVDNRQVLTRVTGLHIFDSFAALYAALPLTECGYTPENVCRADPRDMEAYYAPEKQKQYGVLAIELQRVRYPLETITSEAEVRELKEADVPEMLRLAQENPLYYEHMGIEPTYENISETLTALPPRRTMADKHIFGWFEGQRLIALMDLIAHHPMEQSAFIGWFMMDAERQGKGYGRRIIFNVMRMLADCGVQEVRLGRIAGNPQSEAFWKACGFRDTELGYDTDGYHVIVMSKTIG